MHAENAERLAQLWTAAQPDVAAFVRTLIRDPDQAQDVLQQVAVQLVRNFDRYDAQRPFTPWAIGVAKHEVLAWRRKRATDRHIFTDAMVDRVAEAYDQLLDDDGLRRRALDECIGEALDVQGREAIGLFYGRGLKSPEIGRQLSMSAGAVRKLLCRSRELLRKCVDARLAAWRSR